MSTLVQKCNCGFVWHENRDMVNVVCPRCKKPQAQVRNLLQGSNTTNRRMPTNKEMEDLRKILEFTGTDDGPKKRENKDNDNY